MLEGASPIAYSRLAGVAGPILLGRAFDATGSYAAAMSQLGAITLIAAALMLTFPKLPPPSHV
jgi:cyanate permease